MRRDDERDGRCYADAFITGQQPDEEGRGAHENDGDDEGVFASDDVAETTEQYGAEGRTMKPAAKVRSAKMLCCVGL